MNFTPWATGWTLRLGWLHIDWTRREAHWHLSITWMDPTWLR